MILSRQRIIISCIVTIVIALAFYIGTQMHNSGDKESNYEQSATTLRNERDQALNNYEAACANYRTLYSAYDQLYKKVGSSSGMDQIAQVDGARGNEDSCYR